MTTNKTGNYVTTADRVRIFYKDWGHGTPIVFSHGWPLSADDWDAQLMFFLAQGYRVIAHDRRGHGLSSKPWDGDHMDTYADDLATLIDALDLQDAALVGHSTGGGEVTRYLGRHGTARVAKAVLISAVPPQMLRTDTNPEGLPLEVFDAIRAGVLADRSQYFKDLALPFYGYNRPAATPSQGVIDTFWLQGMQCSIRSAHACIAQFSETDFTADLAKITIPTLLIHGEDDQIVPIGASARHAVELLPQARLIVYEGAPHGIPTTHKDRINADLLAFLRS